MRLTNIAQMSLPQGRLRSFNIQMSDAPGRSLPLSFDQRRHVGLGERPGSWMAISFRVPEHTSADALSQAWLAVVERHGTFRTAFSRNPEGDLVLTEAAVVGGFWRDHPAVTGEGMSDQLRRVLDVFCGPFQRPSYLLCMVHPEASAQDRRPVVIIGGDHAHLDMWSLAVIVRDMQTYLSNGQENASVDSPLAAAHSFAEHTALLEQMPETPGTIRERWSEILEVNDGAMPRFPLPLGDISEPRAEVVEVRDVFAADEVKRFERRAQESGVRVIAFAVSVLAEVTKRMSGIPLRAVFPVHSRFEQRWRDSVGWFITNSVLECRDHDPTACEASVKEALKLGSYPLQPIFSLYGGMPEKPGMFAISWLDTRRLPILDQALQIQYVSAVIRTDGVMIWFVINDSGLHLRCRYPGTDEARANVGAWLDAVEQGLRQMAEEDILDPDDTLDTQ